MLVSWIAKDSGLAEEQRFRLGANWGGLPMGSPSGTRRRHSNWILTIWRQITGRTPELKGCPRLLQNFEARVSQAFLRPI
jgi:hypothetical protein